MLSLTFTRLAAAVSALAACVTVASSAPLYSGLGMEARELLSRSTPAAPHFVIYSDKWVTGAAPDASALKGYNVYALSFLLASNAVDQAQNWASLTAAQRSSIKSQYSAAGIKVVVSAFGSTETPTSSGVDPVQAADTMAAWVKAYGVDGIDIDYEDLTAFNKKDGSAEAWLIKYTTELRKQLPASDYLITAAPLAPWFSPSMWGSGGGFIGVHKAVGSLIDFYNVQFYNQGTSEYTTCAGLLTASSSAWPETALFQIAANGVDQDKLVIGKPGTTADASNGFMDAGTLAGCVSQAAGKGWDAGVMVWQYPDADSAWITTVRGSTFPISGGSSGGGGTSTTTTTSAGSAPTGGSCSGVGAWSSGVAYTGGQEATYNGHFWTAKWWTEAETPGGSSGVWTDDGSC